MTRIRLTVLGSGSSSGSPVIGCDCPTCQSGDPRNHRSRCSAHLEIGTQHWQIDTGPDFRRQMLAHGISRLDGVFYTHAHADHINGIDDLRAFCYLNRAAVPVWSHPDTIANLTQRFDYVFLPPTPYWNRPVLQAHVLPFSRQGQPVAEIENVPVWHFAVPHGHWTCGAVRVGNIAWLTDLNAIDDDIIHALQGLDYLFLDCLMDHAYPSHLSTEQAFAYAERIQAAHTFFIHMTHSLEYHALAARCPARTAPAFDGLTIECEYGTHGAAPAETH